MARIAYEELQINRPDVLDMANGMLQGLSDYTSFEKDFPFVECATWADEIKEEGLDI